LTYRGINALAECVIGLYKTEVIRRRGPWKGLDDVELATLTWVPGTTPSACSSPSGMFRPRRYSRNGVSGKPGAVQFASLVP
jgi:putative transposase